MAYSESGVCRALALALAFSRSIGGLGLLAFNAALIFQNKFKKLTVDCVALSRATLGAALFCWRWPFLAPSGVLRAFGALSRNKLQKQLNCHAWRLGPHFFKT
jgi:hypothetical protein